MLVVTSIEEKSISFTFSKTRGSVSVRNILRLRKLPRRVYFALFKRCTHRFCLKVFKESTLGSLSEFLILFYLNTDSAQKKSMLMFFNLKGFLRKRFKFKMPFYSSTPIFYDRICSICLCDLKNKVLQLMCGQVFHSDYLEYKKELKLNSMPKQYCPHIRCSFQ